MPNQDERQPRRIKRSNGSRYVKKNETSDFLMTHSFHHIVMNRENNSFRRMVFDIGIMEEIEEIVGG